VARWARKELLLPCLLAARKEMVQKPRGFKTGGRGLTLNQEERKNWNAKRILMRQKLTLGEPLADKKGRRTMARRGSYRAEGDVRIGKGELTYCQACPDGFMRGEWRPLLGPTKPGGRCERGNIGPEEKCSCNRMEWAGMGVWFSRKKLTKVNGEEKKGGSVWKWFFT